MLFRVCFPSFEPISAPLSAGSWGALGCTYSAVHGVARAGLSGFGISSFLLVFYRFFWIFELKKENILSLRAPCRAGLRLQDFLLVSYICFTYGVPLPFIAADEAFGAIRMAHQLLRRAGAFFVSRGGERGKGESLEKEIIPKIKKVLLQLFVKCVARRYGVLEVFLEGGRSKTGAFLFLFFIFFFFGLFWSFFSSFELLFLCFLLPFYFLFVSLFDSSFYFFFVYVLAFLVCFYLVYLSLCGFFLCKPLLFLLFIYLSLFI